jgi:hypothetical protein
MIWRLLANHYMFYYSIANFRSLADISFGLQRDLHKGQELQATCRYLDASDLRNVSNSTGIQRITREPKKIWHTSAMPLKHLRQILHVVTDGKTQRSDNYQWSPKHLGGVGSRLIRR